MKKEIKELAEMLDEIEKKTNISLESWWKETKGRDYFVDLILRDFKENMSVWAKRYPDLYKYNAQMIRKTYKDNITGNVIPFNRVKNARVKSN